MSLVWVLAATGGLSTAHAQTRSAPPGVIAPPSSPVGTVQIPPEPKVLPPPVEQPSAVPAGSEGGLPVAIVSIAIEGATLYSPDELRSLLADIAGAKVTRDQVVDAVLRIQTKYRRDGYFLTVARGVLDPVAGGSRLTVRVTEGYIKSVKIDGDIGPAAGLVYGYLRKLEWIRPTRIEDVERYALLAQDVPGIKLRTVLRPSEDEPGAVELVAVVERKAFDGWLSDDNRGPRSAGPNQLLVGAAANSFTGVGERTEVVIFDTPFNEEQLFGQASVEGYLGTEGLKLRGYAGGGYSYPGGNLSLLGYRSRVTEAGVGAEYPAIRTRRLSFFLSSALDLNNSEIDLLGADGGHHLNGRDRLRIFRFGGTLDVQDDLLGQGRAAATTFSAMSHVGLPWLGGDENGAPAPQRAGERRDFTKFTAEAIRVQNLATFGKYGFALKLAVAGQWTEDILPPSEQFFLGGNRYGRGFFAGEVVGDRVIAATIEPQINDSVLVTLGGHPYDIGLQYYGFYDVGQTWELGRGDFNQHIETAGVGVRASVTPHLSLEVEGVERFTRRPTAAVGSRETEQAAYFRVGLSF